MNPSFGRALWLAVILSTLLNAATADAQQTRPRALLPFAPGEFSGTWRTTECLDEAEMAQGTFWLQIARNRKVTGEFFNEFEEQVGRINGTVSRAGIIRARLAPRRRLDGFIIVGTNLIAQGFFSGKCAGVFTSQVFDPPACVTCTNPPPPSIIADSNLLAALAWNLGKPAAGITAADIGALDYFYSYYADIGDLTGLEFATNLRSAYFTGNPITNYSALFQLPNLQSFGVGSVGADAPFLTNFTRVNYLGISSTGLRDVRPVLAMTNLWNLDISQAPVTNITVLADHPSLRSLQFRTVGLGDLAGFERFRLGNIDLADNQVRDVRPLASITTLGALSLARNPITNAAELAPLTNLYSLDLDETSIDDIGWLQSWRLQYLRLSHNAIRDTQPLAGFTNLSQLQLSFNPIQDASPLGTLTRLYTLGVDGCGLTDIDFAANLPWLNSLNISSNALTDIAGITGHSNLWHLNLSWNSVTNLAPLGASRRLTYLYAIGNNIADLSGLSGMTNLYTLVLSGNAITNLAPLADSVELRSLDLANNELRDITPLLALPNLTYVDLRGNRLDLTLGTVAENVVTTLRNRQVTVSTSNQRP